MQNKRAYIWGFMGRFVPQIIYVLTTMFLARYLTPADFGQIGVLTVFFSIANTLMDSGLGGSLIKEKKISALDCSTISCFNIVISIFVYIFLFILAPEIEQYFNVKGLSSVMRILCLVFVINSFALVPKTLLTRNLKFKELSFITTWSYIMGAVTSIILAYFKFGVYALVAFQLVIALANVVFSYYYSVYKFSISFSKASFLRLYSFGIFTTICQIVDSFYENILTFLFGKFLSIQSAGYLDQAKKMENAVSNSLATTISGVAFPILTRYKEDKDKFWKESKSIFVTITTGLFPLILMLALFSKEIILIVFGKKWLAASPYFSLLLFAGLFSIMETLNRNFIKSIGAVKQLAIITLIKRFVGLFIIVAFLLLFSPEEMLYGYILSCFIGFLINDYLLCNLLGRNCLINMIYNFKIIFPILFVFVFLCLLHIKVTGLYFYICSFLMLLFLYVCILPRIGGINIIKLVKKKNERAI